MPQKAIVNEPAKLPRNSAWWRNTDNMQRTFHSTGNSIFTGIFEEMPEFLSPLK